ncbi:hypothetical protein NDU88_010687 [Pleurodeles waltl]|uniref:Uncharacterized protein n=1 Tax=Pleurodeles waltl TaxID=8319 RepID=A0AAV7S235_PLEWA|nr:hypothetical protein NDU88_010687 [Pleurodeles waltl]
MRAAGQWRRMILGAVRDTAVALMLTLVAKDTKQRSGRGERVGGMAQGEQGARYRTNNLPFQAEMEAYRQSAIETAATLRTAQGLQRTFLPEKTLEIHCPRGTPVGLPESHRNLSTT